MARFVYKQFYLNSVPDTTRDDSVGESNDADDDTTN